MKVATILPQSYLHLASEDTYHMALAHLIGKEGYDTYTKFFETQAAIEGNYVIMDNGVIETGQSLLPGEIYMAGQRINAHEIVLPDAFQDAAKTVYMVTHDAKFLKHDIIPTYKYKPKLMAVPQGRTIDEWVGCALILCEIPEIDTIGIPKVLGSYSRDGRLEAIKKVADINWFNNKDLHLLGCWVTPLELTTIAKASSQGHIPMVRGVDSVIAYNMARADLKLNEDDRPNQDPVDFSDGLLRVSSQEQLLLYNIGLYRQSVDTLVREVVYM